jgi:transcriptional regulator with XRE-family HTH domain
MSGRTHSSSLLDEVRQAIRDCGLSLNQLGQLAGVDSGRLSRFMRGERDLTGQAISKLAEALRLKIVRPEAESGKSTVRTRITEDTVKLPKKD